MKLSDKFLPAFPHPLPLSFLKVTVVNYRFTVGRILIGKYILEAAGWEVSVWVC